MAQLEMKNISGQSVGNVELDDAVFAAEINEHLLWEVVKWQLAKRRAGTHSVKRRGEVRGTTKKSHKQKGTGRARAGSQRVSQWVGGGSVFGPKPRSYEYTMPKKAKKKALRGALSLRAREQKIIVLDAFPAANGKTKSVAAVLAALGAAQPKNSVLIVDSRENSALISGARNLPASRYLAPEGLNVYDVLNHQTLILTSETAKQIEQALRP